VLRRHLLAAAALPLAVQTQSQAQTGPAPRVQLAGVMGGKALLMIDGQTQMLAVGASARGVRLQSLQGDSAVVVVGGDAVTLRVGASPVAAGGARPAGGGRREIVLAAGPGGHFMAGGAINGRSVTFMVDTGATVIALSAAEAARLRLDLSNGQRGLTHTANGTVPVVAVTLSTVRVGEVEVANVPAVVTPVAMPYVLLGNSFLNRFQMRRDNDVMRLELR
jgi:aspartyl protease family protein